MAEQQVKQLNQSEQDILAAQGYCFTDQELHCVIPQMHAAPSLRLYIKIVIYSFDHLSQYLLVFVW